MVAYACVCTVHRETATEAATARRYTAMPFAIHCLVLHGRVMKPKLVCVCVRACQFAQGVLSLAKPTAKLSCET